MDVPGVVAEALGEETVEASVALGGDDRLFVTPTRTLVYRSEGLLSDESVEEYTHEVDRITVSEGRRNTTITLIDTLGNEETITVSTDTTDEALQPMLAGVLRANRVIDAEETVLQLYRLSELSVLLTDKQLIKHVGAAVWDEDYETAPYQDVTGLTIEEGDVATQIVLEVAGRPHRIKAPKQTAKQLRGHLETVLREHHDIDEQSELNAALKPNADDDEDSEEPEAGLSLESGVDSLTKTIADVTGESHTEEDQSTEQLSEAGFEPPEEAKPAVARELTELQTAIEEQTELLNRQQELLEQLIEELRRRD